MAFFRGAKPESLESLFLFSAVLGLASVSRTMWKHEFVRWEGERKGASTQRLFISPRTKDSFVKGHHHRRRMSLLRVSIPVSFSRMYTLEIRLSRQPFICLNLPVLETLFISDTDVPKGFKEGGRGNLSTCSFL